MDAQNHGDFGAIIPSFLDDYPLDPYEFRLFARIQRRSGKRECFESLPNMAKGCYMSLAKARLAFRVLTECRIISVKDRASEGKTYVCTINPINQWVAADKVKGIRKTLSPTKSDRATESDTPVGFDRGGVSNSIGGGVSNSIGGGVSNSIPEGIPLNESISNESPNSKSESESENSASLEEPGSPTKTLLPEQPCQPSNSNNDKAYPEDKDSAPPRDNTTVDTQGGAYRMEQRFRQPKYPAYRTGKGANGIKSEFLEYLRAKYLPTTNHYQGRQIELIDAKTWVFNKESAGQQELVEARYEQMLTDAAPKPSTAPQVSYEPLPEKKCWLPPIEEREAFKKQLRAKKAGLK